MITIIFIFKLFLLALLLGLAALGGIWLWTALRAPVPFIPVPERILAQIVVALDIKPGSVVYDLGCGDARVLFYAAQRIEGATFIGIENGLFPRIVARAALFLKRRTLKSKVVIISKDFFKEDLSNATHVFVYLYGRVLDKLLPKLDRELRPGVRLVSATFQFSKKEALQHIALGGKAYDIARDLYVYEW